LKEPPSPPANEKVDFKRHLPSKEETRRKNYIGDSIIAERDDEHVDCEDREIPMRQEEAAKSSKVSKIAKLCNESLREYKEQRRHQDIKRVED
jgi:hypothetical protein